MTISLLTQEIADAHRIIFFTKKFPHSYFRGARSLSLFPVTLISCPCRNSKFIRTERPSAKFKSFLAIIFASPNPDRRAKNTRCKNYYINFNLPNSGRRAAFVFPPNPGSLLLVIFSAKFFFLKISLPQFSRRQPDSKIFKNIFFLKN